MTLAAQIRSIWVRALPGACSRFQVRVEERDDPAAGILCGRLVIAGVGDPRQDAGGLARLSPGLVQKGVPGVRVHLDVVVDPDRLQRPAEPPRRGPREPVPPPKLATIGQAPYRASWAFLRTRL